MNQFEAKEQVTEIQEEMKHLKAAISFYGEELDKMENSPEHAAKLLERGELTTRLGMLFDIMMSKSRKIELAAEEVEKQLK